MSEVNIINNQFDAPSSIPLIFKNVYETVQKKLVETIHLIPHSGYSLKEIHEVFFGKEIKISNEHITDSFGIPSQRPIGMYGRCSTFGFVKNTIKKNIELFEGIDSVV